MPVITQIQLRRDTAANWSTVNPVLAAGEAGFESDTNKLKIGNGSSAWNALPYVTGGGTATYTHTQGSAASTWTINHNLGRKVDCELYTVGGMEMMGDIVHTTLNQTVVTFVAPVAGSAYIH